MRPRPPVALVRLAGEAMNTTELAELAKLKQGARATWAAGDFPAIARAPAVGGRAAHRRGRRTSVPARTCSTSPAGPATPRCARRRPAAPWSASTSRPSCSTPAGGWPPKRTSRSSGCRATRRICPFEDESFDVVALDLRLHVRAAARGDRARARARAAARRPARDHQLDAGRRRWAAFFRTVGPYLPPPSPLAQPPVLWGSEEHVARAVRGTADRARVRP